MKRIIALLLMLIVVALAVGDSEVVKVVKGKVIWRAYFAKDTQSTGYGITYGPLPQVAVCGQYFAVAKYDAITGRKIWAKGRQSRLGNSEAVAMDSAGNVFVGGVDQVAMVKKHDSRTGRLIWRRTVSTRVNPYVTAITVDKANNVYVSTEWLASNDDLGISCTKLDGKSGKIVWSKDRLLSEGLIIDYDMPDALFCEGNKLIHGVDVRNGTTQAHAYDLRTGQMKYLPRLRIPRWRFLNIVKGYNNTYRIYNTGSNAVG